MGAVVNEGCDAVFLLVAGTWFVACVTLIAAGFMNFLWQRELHDNNADSPVPLGPRFDFWPRRRWRTDVNWYKALLGNGRPGPGETYRKWAKRLFLISIVLLIAFLALATTAAVGSSANYLRSARASAQSVPSSPMPLASYRRLRLCLVNSQFAVLRESFSAKFGYSATLRRQSYAIVDVAPSVVGARAYAAILQRSVRLLVAGIPSERGLDRLVARHGTVVTGWTDPPSRVERRALGDCVLRVENTR